MNSRPPLSRNIPFWILAVGSLVLAGFGAWLVVSQLQGVLPAVTAQNNATTIDEQIGAFVTVTNSGAIVGVGAAILAAGLLGLVLTLAVAAISGLRPTPVVDAPAAWTHAEDEIALAPVEETEVSTANRPEDIASGADRVEDDRPEAPTAR